MKCNPHWGSRSSIYSLIYQTGVRPPLLVLCAAESSPPSTWGRALHCSTPHTEYRAPPLKTLYDTILILPAEGSFVIDKWAQHAWRLVLSWAKTGSMTYLNLCWFQSKSVNRNKLLKATYLSVSLHVLEYFAQPFLSATTFLSSIPACSRFLGPTGGTVTLATPPVPLPHWLMLHLAPPRHFQCFFSFCNLEPLLKEHLSFSVALTHTHTTMQTCPKKRRQGTYSRGGRLRPTNRWKEEDMWTSSHGYYLRISTPECRCLGLIF